MSARIVDPRVDPGAIAEAVAILRAGGLVGLPTETVYGLGARALDAAALARIFLAKGRPTSHPLIAHVLDLPGALAVAADVSAARSLAAAFWPGPLTFVLPRRAGTPDLLSAGLDTVAVRAPAHPVARAVIAALGEPIAAPSANRYQEVSPTTAAHVARSLGEAVALILDGGATERGIESTVVDLTGPPTILRLGPIDELALRAVLPSVRIKGSDVIPAGEARSSPGLDARHYAPRADANCFFAATVPKVGAGDGVILCGNGLVGALGGGAHVIVLPSDASGYAAGLYAALHTLDDAGARRIWIEEVPQGRAWDAVRDRITRATTR